MVNLLFTGKYSDFKNIKEDSSRTNGQKVNGGSLNDEKIDEITPLMHQATISPTNDETISNIYSTHKTSTKSHNHQVNGTANSHSSSNGKSHRKRFKTKSGRKLSSYNVAENNLSDS